MFDGNPDACVANGDLNFIVHTFCGDRDASAFGRVLQRVAREVGQNLNGAVFVGEERRKVGSQFEVRMMMRLIRLEAASRLVTVRAREATFQWAKIQLIGAVFDALSSCKSSTRRFRRSASRWIC